jgi:2-dehydro-3-deoxyphosphooctonate aldolase (KDO 8-P synthase)
MIRHIQIGALTIGNDRPYVLIAGPCQIESRDHALETAAALGEICVVSSEMDGYADTNPS